LAEGSKGDSVEEVEVAVALLLRAEDERAKVGGRWWGTTSVKEEVKEKRKEEMRAKRKRIALEGGDILPRS
jgi:hypothetical protein